MEVGLGAAARTGSEAIRAASPACDSAAAHAADRDDGAFVWGASAAMRALRAQLDAVASTRSSVLLVGETGTGKGALARWIHRASPAGREPFVHFDCAAVPPSLLESALFGHERGAFTGAHALRIGAAEAAGLGTLFLDEVSELERTAQARLLRVLQDRVFERVGGTRTQRLGARVLAASNRDLAAAVASGELRADLFYRLAVAVIRVPALRERRDDLPGLLAHAAAVATRRTGGPPLRLAPDGVRALANHAWPGNVRELLNTLERAAACWPGREVDAALASELLDGAKVGPAAPAPQLGLGLERARSSPDDAGLREMVEHAGGNVSRAARVLGLPRSTRRYRLARLARQPVPGSGAPSATAPAEGCEQLSLPGFGRPAPDSGSVRAR